MIYFICKCRNIFTEASSENQANINSKWENICKQVNDTHQKLNKLQQGIASYLNQIEEFATQNKEHYDHFK